MLTALLILVIATVSVHSQSQLLPELQFSRTICQSLKQTPFNGESCVKYQPTMPTRCEGAIKITKTAQPTACAPKMPVIPFVTELPSCPDLCFNEILTSPLGCLDPILNVYSAAAIIETPVSPMLPAASPVSPLAPPFSNVLPPASPCDRDSHFLTRVPIPPPFI